MNCYFVSEIVILGRGKNENSLHSKQVLRNILGEAAIGMFSRHFTRNKNITFFSKEFFWVPFE